MRVGIQARVGVDALVAAGPGEMTLGDGDGSAILGLDTVLAGPAEAVTGAMALGVGTRLS
jgi:hypothetical protein